LKTTSNSKKKKREKEREREREKRCNILKSNGCVTQAARLLALPPNQKGYLMGCALCFFFFFSPACSCGCDWAEEAACAAAEVIFGGRAIAFCQRIAEEDDERLRGHSVEEAFKIYYTRRQVPTVPVPPFVSTISELRGV
jgi:hypothetical protein